MVPEQRRVWAYWYFCVSEIPPLGTEMGPVDSRAWANFEELTINLKHAMRTDTWVNMARAW